MNKLESPSQILFELLRFGSVGLIATAIHSGVYLTALHFMIPQAANLGGYLCALLVSYLGHGKVTFRQSAQDAEAPSGRRWKFAIVSMLGLFLNSAFVYLCENVLASAPWVAVIFIGGITPAITYIFLKLWVFAEVRGQ